MNMIPHDTDILDSKFEFQLGLPNYAQQFYLRFIRSEYHLFSIGASSHMITCPFAQHPRASHTKPKRTSYVPD
jgi:hypothetical protein